MPKNTAVLALGGEGVISSGSILALLFTLTSVEGRFES